MAIERSIISQLYRANLKGDDEQSSLCRELYTHYLELVTKGLVDSPVDSGTVDAISPPGVQPSEVGYTVDQGVVSIEGRRVTLTRGESRLFNVFARNPGTVLTVDQLSQTCWGPKGSERVVVKAVERLRRKLEPDPTGPRTLVNVWGRGYMLSNVRISFLDGGEAHGPSQPPTNSQGRP